MRARFLAVLTPLARVPELPSTRTNATSTLLEPLQAFPRSPVAGTSAAWFTALVLLL